MNYTRKEFENSYASILRRINTVTSQLTSIGEGQIVCRKHGNKLYYTEKQNNKEVGITRNFPRIQQLVRKEFLIEELKLLKQNLKTLDYCRQHFQDISSEILGAAVSKKITNLPVSKIITSDAEKWRNKNWLRNSSFPEDLRYVSTNGVVLRSKSEREIANALEAAGISYKADVKIECNGEIYYANFVIYKDDGTEVIWEHFGLEDNRKYMAGNRVRLEDYINVLGLRPWKNLIWTYDSDIEDSRVIREIIQRFLLA